MVITSIAVLFEIILILEPHAGALFGAPLAGIQRVLFRRAAGPGRMACVRDENFAGKACHIVCFV
jgi:hypothetical protein